MKTLLIIALAIISLNVQAQEAKTYMIKSGYIKYQLGGSTNGTKELWWDDYGQKTCETEKSTTTTKIFGIKNTEEKHSTTVTVNNKFWVANYIDNKGSNGTVPMYNEGQEYFGDMTEKEQQEFADEVLAGLGGEKIGTESLNGYECDVIKIMGIKSWIHKGLVLKTEGKIMGIEANEMFVDFKPNTKVASSKFNPPAGVDYQNLSEQAGAQGFMGALGALGEMDEMEDDDDEYEITPVDYPFDKFSKIVKGCSIDGYHCARVSSLDGSHIAIFMNGLNTIVVSASSDKDMDTNKDSELDSFDSFKHNGHNCYHGVMEEDNGTVLLVEYPSDDMIISIMAMPQKSKDELLTIHDQLNF